MRSMSASSSEPDIFVSLRDLHTNYTLPKTFRRLSSSSDSRAMRLADAVPCASPGWRCA
jgi:hypothetical protein